MNRCSSLRESLRERALSAAIVHRPEDIRYLTGYTGEGCVLVTPGRQIILTDFRYVEQAGQQAPECECLRTNAGASEGELLHEAISAEGITAVGMETDYLTCDAFSELTQALPGVELKPLRGRIEEMRAVKDASEVECICRAAAIASEAFGNILEKIRPGVTERELRIALDFEMLRLGSEGDAFDTIVASGENGSLCHAIPSDRKIAPGDFVTMDFGAKVGGYCSDMTRTVAVGKPSQALFDIYRTVLTAQKMALEAIRPGRTGRELDQIAREVIEPRYPGAFGHSLGHGVGLFIHEEPRLSQKSRDVLRPGHVVTVEPGVYLPGVGGCRIEDMVILTEDGFINPVTAPKELIVL